MSAAKFRVYTVLILKPRNDEQKELCVSIHDEMGTRPAEIQRMHGEYPEDIDAQDVLKLVVDGSRLIRNRCISEEAQIVKDVNSWRGREMVLRFPFKAGMAI